MNRVMIVMSILWSCGVLALDNGLAQTPPLGWSSWNLFQFNVSESLVKQTAQALISTGLSRAGFLYVLVDDGWSACDSFAADGSCLTPSPRDEQGRIRPDKLKFPNGMKSLASYVHSIGLKIGIYTAVSGRTCGGYSGSLAYEAIDAKTFADWDMDFVKHDTCNADCGIHNGCIINSTAAMRDGLNATGRPMLYYIDDGNDTTGQRLFNPNLYHVPNYYTIKIGTKWQELVWVWGPSHANMFKSWFDRSDNWASFLDNIHHQISLAIYQQKGGLNTPDMVTIGQGGMSLTQYKSEISIYAVLGAPIILGCDVRNISSDIISLLTNPEVLKIDQDEDCVQGSLVRMTSGGEIWVKPLKGGNFAVGILNKMPTPLNISVLLPNDNSGGSNGGDFYPAQWSGGTHVRDVWRHVDVGVFDSVFSKVVLPFDTDLFIFSPLSK